MAIAADVGVIFVAFDTNRVVDVFLFDVTVAVFHFPRFFSLVFVSAVPWSCRCSFLRFVFFPVFAVLISLITTPSTTFCLPSLTLFLHLRPLFHVSPPFIFLARQPPNFKNVSTTCDARALQVNGTYDPSKAHH